jgi:prephenate dehydratase
MAFDADHLEDGLSGRLDVNGSVRRRIADIHPLLPYSRLHILGEHFMPIRHQLLGLKDASLDDISGVYSQAPALAQCRSLLRERKWAAHTWYDTAGSAKHVAELGDKSVAAIASSLAAEFYGLKILKADIEEHHNATRFLIMSRG